MAENNRGGQQAAVAQRRAAIMREVGSRPGITRREIVASVAGAHRASSAAIGVDLNLLTRAGYISREEGHIGRYALPGVAFPEPTREQRSSRRKARPVLADDDGPCDTCGKQTPLKARATPADGEGTAKLVWRCRTCQVALGSCSILHRWDREAYPSLKRELLGFEARSLALSWLQDRLSVMLSTMFAAYEVPKRIPMKKLVKLAAANGGSPRPDELRELRTLRMWQRWLEDAEGALEKQSQKERSTRLRSFEEHQVADNTYELAKVITGDGDTGVLPTWIDWVEEVWRKGTLFLRCPRCSAEGHVANVGTDGCWAVAAYRSSFHEAHAKCVDATGSNPVGSPA